MMIAGISADTERRVPGARGHARRPGAAVRGHRGIMNSPHRRSGPGSRADCGRAAAMPAGGLAASSFGLPKNPASRQAEAGNKRLVEARDVDYQRKILVHAWFTVQSPRGLS